MLLLLLLRLMDVFIKRLRSRAGMKRGSGTCATFQRMRQTKNKKEDQDIGSSFLLVGQINTREMMKEKEKRKRNIKEDDDDDDAGGLSAFWLLYMNTLGCPTIHHPSGALLLYSAPFFHSPNSSQNQLGKMKKGEKRDPRAG